MATITTVDGRKLEEETLILDDDGYWETQGGALCLVAPSVAFEIHRTADKAAAAASAASMPPSHEERMAALFEIIGDDPALSPATKAAITDTISLLKG